jgi:hypothetical protein
MVVGTGIAKVEDEVWRVVKDEKESLLPVSVVEQVSEWAPGSVLQTLKEPIYQGLATLCGLDHLDLHPGGAWLEDASTQGKIHPI